MNEVEALIRSLTESWNVRMAMEKRIRELEAKVKELESAGKSG
jgi:hypothetical protein